MSKKKNAFYYFMQDFREDQKRKGIPYANMAEVAVACDPLWKDATPEERAKYKEKANMDKNRNKDPEFIYTSSGISLADIQRREKQQIDAEIAERQDVKNLVKQMACNGAIIDEDFFFIDVNYFCKHISNVYIIGESTVLQLSLKDGLKNKYHEIVHPGKIPIGYQSDVKLGAKDIGLDMPDERVPGSDYRQILTKLTKFLKQNNCELATIPPLFTMPDKVLPVRSFVQQMCIKAGVDVNNFRVYRLDTLLYRLSNAVKSEFDEGFPKEHVALAQLRKELTMFAPGTACEVHEEADRALACCEGRVKCWAYTVLDSCCPLAGVTMWPSSHVPPDPDIGTVQIPAYPPGLRENLRLGPHFRDPTRLASDANKSSLSHSYVALNTWSNNNHSKSTLVFSSDSEGEADSECTSTSIAPPPQLIDRTSPESQSGIGLRHNSECTSTSIAPPPPPPQLIDRTSPEPQSGIGLRRRRHIAAYLLAKMNLKK